MPLSPRKKWRGQIGSSAHPVYVGIGVGVTVSCTRDIFLDQLGEFYQTCVGI